MNQVDLEILAGEPSFRGSVQTMYEMDYDGERCLLSQALDEGSVFDVGTFFSVPNSGRARNALRHVIFTRLADPAFWDALEIADFARSFEDQGVGERLYKSDVMESLRRNGVRTHHLGLVDEESGLVISDPDTETKSALVLIRKFPVIRPDRVAVLGTPVYDYHKYSVASEKVIALEHVVRFGIPGGSSILDRYNSLVKQGDKRAAAILLERYRVKAPPVPWTRLSAPACDWATKFEDQDRHLSTQEAMLIGGVPVETMATLVDLIQLCAIQVESLFSQAGLQLWDLKWELAYDQGQIVLVDTLDQDSMRVTYKTNYRDTPCYVHFNKQAIRDFYRVLYPNWHAALNDAKIASASSSEAEGFMEIYRRGVESGKYPDIPDLDEEFASIQGAKYEFLYDAARGRAQENDAEFLAVEELKFYEKRGVIDSIVQLNQAEAEDAGRPAAFMS